MQRLDPNERRTMLASNAASSDKSSSAQNTTAYALGDPT
jgi:hypothetical protein